MLLQLSQRSDVGQTKRHVNEAKMSTKGRPDSFAWLEYHIAGNYSGGVILTFIRLLVVVYITRRPISVMNHTYIFFFLMFLVENVEDLLLLSHEYQVKQHIFDPCVKFLEDQTKTKENVMKILALAKLYNLEKVHQGCIDLLKNMRLESLSETVHLQDLDKEQTQYYLTQRIERLETVLDEVYPQFFGVVTSFITTYQNVSRCNTHVPYGTFSRPVSYLQIRHCPKCKSMLSSIVEKDRWNNSYVRDDDGYHFDSNLFSVMHDFSKLKT